jgi:hypothetical protein
MNLIHFIGNIRIEVAYEPTERIVNEIISISVEDADILNDLMLSGAADVIVDSVDWPEVYVEYQEPSEIAA